MLAEGEKTIRKSMDHDSKTGDQKRIKQNCFHRGYVRRCGYFGSRSRSRRWPAAGREEKRKKHSLSFSANPTKHPAGVRKKKKTRGLAQKTPNVLELSLSVLCGLETSTKTSGKWRRNGDGAVTTANLPRPLLFN